MDSVRTEILENHPISLNTIVNRIYSKLILKIGIRLLLEIAHQSESIQIENGELREVLVLLS
jgi:hypothetical protein